jgi:PAS domain-containing protein
MGQSIQISAPHHMPATREPGVWMWDLDSESCWDPRALEIFGHSENTLITPELFRRQVHPADSNRVEEALRLAIETRGFLDVEYGITRPDGAMRRVRSCARVYCCPKGYPLRMMGLCWDVTPRLFVPPMPCKECKVVAVTAPRAAEWLRRVIRDLYREFCGLLT